MYCSPFPVMRTLSYLFKEHKKNIKIIIDIFKKILYNTIEQEKYIKLVLVILLRKCII